MVSQSRGLFEMARQAVFADGGWWLRAHPVR
jgi:hypothetical protein